VVLLLLLHCFIASSSFLGCGGEGPADGRSEGPMNNILTTDERFSLSRKQVHVAFKWLKISGAWARRRGAFI
jgi:hypothetical protein